MALLVSVRAQAEQISAEALLQQMQRAYHHYNFELTLVKVRQGQLEPLRFSHGQLADQELVHLISLNGRPSEYLKRNDNISFFESTHEPYTLSGARMPGLWPAVLEMNLERVLRSYEPVVTGRNRVAGLPAQVVRLTPRGHDKYGFMLWLEQETGLLLRLDMLDPDGNLVEQYLGVDLRILPQPGQWLSELASARLPAVMAMQEAYPAPQQAPAWRPGWLPTGFRLVSSDRHPLAVVEQMADYLLISDGLVDVSIYVLPEDETRALPNQLVRQGATSLLSYRNEHKVEVTVVGEIPAETARRIAESLQPHASK